jgi:hypothetical protein
VAVLGRECSNKSGLESLGHLTVGARTSYNNVVGASARLRRAPEYTARRLWCGVDGGE